MRRIVFLSLGLLEVLVAILLVSLGWLLPDRDNIETSFGKAERVTQRAGDQVRRLRQQVQDLRRPELQQLASRLQTQLKTVTAMLREQSIDFSTVATVRDALETASEGLHNLSNTLDPRGVGKVGEGMSRTAQFLEEKLIPAAASAAKQLDQSTGLMRHDARLLADFFREAPADLKAVREVHDSLDSFGRGLAKMGATLDLKRLDAMRDGFRGMEEALTTGAEEVERLSTFTYPVLTFDGLKPEIDQRPFWPQGDRIASGLRKAGAGVTAAGKEMDEMAKGLPELRSSLEASRKVVDQTRATLAAVLEQQSRIEPLLQEMPRHAAKLAESLPQLGEDLARILRDTQRFQEVADALRQGQQGIDDTVRRWPELRQAMLGAANLLRATQQQLERALHHQKDYERAMKQTVLLGEAFAAMLPLLSEQMVQHLGEEEAALDELGDSIDEVGSVLPQYGTTTGRLVQTGRLLSWLVAAIVVLHGAYLILSVWLGRRYSV